jgi:hypothetical protein
LFSCFRESETGNGTSGNQENLSGAYKKVEIDLTTIFEGYDVPPDDPKVLRHTNPGEVVFLSRPIKAPFWFHDGDFIYQYPEPQYRRVHEEKVKIAVRLSTDGEHWTEWDENVHTGGHGWENPEISAFRTFTNTEKLYKYLPVVRINLR